MNLYEISGRFAEIQKQLDFENESMTDTEYRDALVESFNKIEGELNEKVDAYCAIIKQKEAVGKARWEEANRLEALGATDSLSAKRMREAMMLVLNALGKTKLDTVLHKVSIRGNGGKQPLVIEDDTNIPAEWTKVRYDIDRDKIRTALESGEVLDFAVLSPRGSHLSIK